MSLRARLVLLVTGLTTLLLLGLGLYVGGSSRGWATQVVDRELERRAEALAHEVRFEHGALELDDDDGDLEARGWPFRLEDEGGEALAASSFDWPEAALGAHGYATIEVRPGQALRVYARPFTPRHGRGRQLVVRVAAPLTAFSGVASRARWGLLVALLLAALIGAGGSLLLARVFLSPLRRLSREADRIGAGSLDARLSTAGLDPELARLAEAFNGVLGRLEAAFAGQRAFVSRASHALRTPLASILSQAEVTLLRDRDPQAYRKALEAIAQATQDTARLADGLLALSRADEADAAAPREPVPLGALAAELERLFRARADEAGLALSCGADEGLTLTASRDRLREMLDALLDNALRYTPRGGQVRFSARAEAGAVVLEVADTGLGLAPGEREQVVERFVRGSAARRSGQPGSGLGLAVVQALAAAEGATLTLADAPGGGTVARLSFPRR